MMRILHVEDDPLDADLARRRLAEAAPHFRLEQVATYGAALARLGRLDTEPLELVLTDMRLPDGDGLSLLIHIRERGLPLAVVVVTGSGDEETAVAALKAGADDYVVKSNDYVERLPLALEDAYRRCCADAARRARPLKVLYAERDAADVERTRRHFAAHAGHIHLDIVSTGAETLRRLLRRGGRDEYHVVLLDYALPSLDALEVIKELRLTHKSGVPVILIAGQGDEEVALQALKLGASSYLVKHSGYLYKLPVELENAHVRAELTRREEALRESEEFNRRIVESSSDCIKILDLEGRLSYISPRGQELLGIEDPSPYLNGSWIALWPGEGRLAALAAIERAKAGGVGTFQGFGPTLQGQPKWWDTVITPMTDAQGQVVRLLAVSRDITESKRSEDALRESEERNQAILKAIPDLIFLQSREGVYLDYHAQDTGSLYVPPEYFLGKKLHDVLPPELAAAFHDCFERALATGETQVHEYSLPIQDGIRWYEARIARCDGDRLLSVVRDITERKRAEEALKESENQVRLFVEHTPVAVAMFDREMRYLLTSRRWLRDNNLGEQEIIGRCHYDLVPDIPERWRAGHRRCLAGAVEGSEEDIFEHPDGTFDWVRWEIRPWYAAHGEVGGIIMFSETITERKQAAEALRASEERFAKAFQSNPQPMSLTTLDEGRYIDVNESFLDMSGYTREEIVGRTTLELKVCEKYADHTPFVRRLREQGAIHNMEGTFRTRSGAFRVLLSSAELMEIDGQQCILIAATDITERKRAEEELLRLTERLFNLQDDERRRIARELHDGTAQNLFAMTFNLARLQQHEAAQDAKLQRLVADTITLGNESLREIRTLSYLLHPPLLDQAGLVSALRWYVEGFIKRSGIYVDLISLRQIGRLPPEAETALFRIVQESLTNIRRHSGSTTASVRLEKKNGEIVLQVKDEGRGLPPLESPEPDDNMQSLGVGILGMRQRMRQLGGRLEVASDEGGTTVTAIMPFKEGGDRDPHPTG